MDFKKAFELKGGLNGLKLITGAALLVFSHELALAQELIPLFPGASALPKVVEYGTKALSVIEAGVNALGHIGVWLGAAHKVQKLFKKD